MCGIVGSQGILIERTSIESALASFRHRGPDGTYIYSRNSVHLGVNRLAINDLSGGAQPFFNTKADICVIYNGEIYNHKSLRRTLNEHGVYVESQVDGAILPYLYEIYGESFLNLLDGMFAMALVNFETEELILARDVAGEKPLYYSLDGRGLFFSSSLDSFPILKRKNIELDSQSIWDFPSFLWCPQPNTIYRGVFSLLPGEVLCFRDGSAKKSRIEMNPDPNLPKSLEDRVLYVKETIIDSITGCLMSEVPIATFLSGGLDSSIVSMVAAQNIHELNTYSVSFPDQIDSAGLNYNEEPFAQLLAEAFQTNHHVLRLDSTIALNYLEEFVKKADQPFSVSSGLGVFAISKLAQEVGDRVILSGDGADELFGGYSWYSYLPNLMSRRKLLKESLSPTVTMQDIGMPVELRLDIISKYSDEDFLFALHYYATENDKKSLFSNDFQISLNGYESAAKLGSTFGTLQTPLSVLQSDRIMYLNQEMLRKVDLFTMANSIEGRAPFVRKKVLNLAAALSFEELVRDGELKWILRKAFSDQLPKEILNRKKHGFNFPIEEWLQNEWRHLVTNTFSTNSQLFQRGLIDKISIRNVGEFLNSTRKLHGHTLFSFIVLDMFLSRRSNH